MPAAGSLRAYFSIVAFFNVIHFTKLAGQIGIPFGLEAALIRATAARCAFAVVGIELVDDIHARDNPPEWRETLPVKRGVVAEVDENLRGARVRPGGRKGDLAAFVALGYRIVLDLGIAPRRCDFPDRH